MHGEAVFLKWISEIPPKQWERWMKSAHPYLIIIFTEDRYGKPFWKLLVYRLKKEQKFPSTIAFEFKGNVPPCNMKSVRLIKTRSICKNCRIIWIFDGDGHLSQRIKMETRKLTSQSVIMNKIKLLVFEEEVEELFVSSLGNRGIVSIARLSETRS